jgi:5-(carboxyamino)imidazole ribonucleotide synthase
MLTVGILGGGQLGTMLSDAVARLGARPKVYDPDPNAPARRCVPDVEAAPFEDVRALRAFCQACDVVTFEREDLPLEALREATAGTRVLPSLSVLETAQDRAKEKSFFVRSGLPCVRHDVVDRTASLAAACERFGFPLIAKTQRGGYDGKGQFLLASAEEARRASDAFPRAAWVLEEPLTLLAEASCIVARAGTSEAVFPVVENLHREHVLDRSLVPSRLDPAVAARMRELALTAARSLDVHGLLAVEFFVIPRSDRGQPRVSTAPGQSRELAALGDVDVIINELAPRPHNSGHVFGRACTFSQFEAFARILVGAPLGAPRLHPGSHCMGNLLGDVWIAQGRSGPTIDLSAWAQYDDVVDVHVYGKTEPQPRRKMGHFVVNGATGEAALDRAESFRKALSKRA